MKQITTQEEARQYAIDWQAKQAEWDLSYSELVEASIEFEALGEKFGLTEEFKENGII